jgi:endonuclease/exonuclease/phosphatase family metal-dependent hydrolase
MIDGMKNTVKLMSFNVLNGWKPGCPVYRTMQTRSERAARLILEELPDILCLQEYDYYYRHDGAFSALVEGEYAEADTRDETPAESWNPILYKRSAFLVIESGGYDFVANGFVPVSTGNADRETYPPRACNTSKYQYPEDSDEGRAGYAISKFRSLSYAVLKSADGGKIIVANTHYSMRSWCQADEVDFVTEKLNEIKQKHACPLVICGDYNSATHWGAAKRMLEKGFLDTYDMAVVKDDCASCHPSSGKGTDDETDVMPSGNYKTHAIDHIYADRPLTVGSYRIIAREELLSVSDHCPTVIKFKI